VGQGRERRELHGRGRRLHRCATDVVDEYRAAGERVRSLGEQQRLAEQEQAPSGR
jgi:hypothetical protein